jgi:hypothetical protein
MRISDDESRIRPAAASKISTSGTIEQNRFSERPPEDAVQLSFLGGALNAFQLDAAKSAKQGAQLSAAIRQQAYLVDSLTLGKKIIGEFLASH